MPKPFAKTDRIILFITALLLFAYIVARALLVPIVGDEALTFFFYIFPKHINPFTAYYDANNHIVNTVLSVASTSFLGYEVWALRLPNLLSFIIYLIYSYRISQLMPNRFLAYTSIVGLWFVAYFIEYFAYCRGYGLSMAFLMATLYHLYCYINRTEFKNALLVMLFNLLAFASNLALLNTYVILSAVLLGLILLKNTKRKILQHTAIMFVVNVVPGIWLLTYLFLLKDNGRLYYGTDEGFIKGTVTSLVTVLTGNGVEYAHWLKVWATVGWVAMVVVSYMLQKRKALKTVTFVDVLAVLLIGNIVLQIAMAVLLNVKYPVYRVVIYYWPIFLLFTLFVVAGYVHKAKYLLLMPVFYFPVHFVLYANTTHASFWAADHIPASFYSAINKKSSIPGYPPVVVSIELRSLIYAYTNFNLKSSQNPVQFDIYGSQLCNFMIVEKNNCNYDDLLVNYNDVGYDKLSGNLLLERKQPPTYTRIDTAIISPKTLRNEFVNLYAVKADSLHNKNILVAVNLQFSQVLSNAENPYMLITLKNARDKIIKEIKLDVKWYYRPQGNRYNIKYTYLLPDVSAETDSITVKLSNPAKQELAIQPGGVSLYRVN